MNGLEAIKFIQDGGMVIHENSEGKEVLKFEETSIYGRYVGEDVWHRLTHIHIDGCYEEYIEPKALTGWERVERGDEFNYLNPFGVEGIQHLGLLSDAKLYENANYFSTKEKAEEINFKQTLFRKLQRFSDENGGNEIDWKDKKTRKFFIRFCHETNDLAVDRFLTYHAFGQVYFVSIDVAKKAIELFRDDLIKYFTHDWNTGGNE